MSLLELKDVTKIFGGLIAVNEVSFSVEPGSVVGLIGPNGAGKTTVFNCITGNYRPERGSILFDGRDVTVARGTETFDARVLGIDPDGCLRLRRQGGEECVLPSGEIAHVHPKNR